MSNRFGTAFTITTWGESHGKAIGVVIDGCPAGLPLSESDIQPYLDARRPGLSAHTSPRSEPDRVTIESGVFEGKATGAPIALRIENKDAKPSAYDQLQKLLRPGHANQTYLQKYGVFDYRGGGRASARETAARVAAGAVAQKLLLQHGMHIHAAVVQVGNLKTANYNEDEHILSLLETIKVEGDSIGGVVECICTGIPAGLGEPIYGKVEALLAHAMLSIPASKGFEIGCGFAAATMRGSEHNDLPLSEANNAGGTLAGITTGNPLVFRVPFKPTSSIKKVQKTKDVDGNSSTLTVGETGRHDPCVALRAPAVVQAMAALVLADLLLLTAKSQIDSLKPLQSR